MNGAVLALAFPTPWPFWSEGLELDAHGRLALATLPEWPQLPGAGGAPPGGLAVAGGRAYFTCGDAIRVRECDGTYTSFGAVGPRAGLGSVRDPRGLAVSPLHTLVVADHGNDRVQEFDLTAAQLVWVWPGVTEPEDVAVDDEGRVYVAAAEGVVRLDRSGDRTVVASTQELGRRPRSVALGTLADQPAVYVSAGTDPPAIHVIGSTGPARSRLMPALHRAIAGLAHRPPRPLDGPLLLRSHRSRLYLGAPANPATRVVDTALPALLGDLPGTPLPFSAIAIDEEGALWFADCDDTQPEPGRRGTPAGRASIGPIPLRLDPEAPHGLRLRTAGRLGVGGAAVAAAFTPSDGSGDPVGVAPDALVDVPSGTTAVTVHLRLTAPAAGADTASPDYVELVEVRVDEPGWIEHLPAIYRAQGDPGAFLDPYLRLARTGQDDVEAELGDLPNQFDPATAVDDLDGERWLDWLAGWVDVGLDERWDPDTRRSIVAAAFRRHGMRGTRAGLGELIEAELGLTVEISEPGDLASVWQLGDAGAELGFATMTAAGPPGGSIVDATAIADRSHLIGAADYGTPLFGDVAHRFDVRVHAAHLRCEDDERRLRALIEREKPAHAIAHLCVIEPGISVGVQSRLGVDTVVGGAGDPRAVGGLEGFERDRPGGRVAVGDEGPLVLR